MPTPEQRAAARHLLLTRSAGVLSTHSVQLEGHPFGSYLPFCRDSADGLLGLLSGLAEHTRNLQADARCALTLVSDPAGSDTRRLTLCGRMRLAVPDPLGLARYARYFPQAPDPRLLPDFKLARFELERAYWIGGTAQTCWLSPAELQPVWRFDPHQEAAFVGDYNAEAGHALRESWQHLTEQVPKDAVYLLGIDAEGGELRCGPATLRFAFPHALEKLPQVWEHLQRQALLDLGWVGA
ncbi:MAG: pyridoxamine 5'-phosphate oxidase family protein [Candidatus Sericytochromatia bacterium]